MTVDSDLQSVAVDSSSHLLLRDQRAAADVNVAVGTSVSCAADAQSGSMYGGVIQCQHRSETGGQTDIGDENKPTCDVVDVETSSVQVRSGGHQHATRSLVLILALSLHRIFEGMSVGLQQTVANVVSLFGAVMCHEMVIGFSLGLQFVRSGFALRRLLITTIVCSSIMPLGVLIGIVMTEIESGSGNIDVANGLLQAIAMGTFIYVTFFEILQEEIDSEDTSLGKIVCIAAGFALMAMLNLIPEGNVTGTAYLNTSTVVSPTNATLIN